MPFEIIISEDFERDASALARRHRSLLNDIEQLMAQLAVNPAMGTPIGKNCYKIRMAITSKGKGKSGGARVITCVKIVAQNVHLVSIFDKSDMENISEKELTQRLKRIFEGE